LTWATHLKGKTFYLSIINDAYVEPRWRPDWISPDFLAADIYGRLLGSVQRLGDAAPPSWSKGLSDAQSSMVANVPPMAHTFPGLLQGGSTKILQVPSMPGSSMPVSWNRSSRLDRSSRARSHVTVSVLHPALVVCQRHSWKVRRLFVHLS
jgi:hypothetical protein